MTHFRLINCLEAVGGLLQSSCSTASKQFKTASEQFWTASEQLEDCFRVVKNCLEAISEERVLIGFYAVFKAVFAECAF
jgi:hypothetical protein